MPYCLGRVCGVRLGAGRHPGRDRQWQRRETRQTGGGDNRRNAPDDLGEQGCRGRGRSPLRSAGAMPRSDQRPFRRGADRARRACPRCPGQRSRSRGGRETLGVGSTGRSLARPTPTTARRCIFHATASVHYEGHAVRRGSNGNRADGAERTLKFAIVERAPTITTHDPKKPARHP